jgi:ATP-binding cassette subfamily C protein
LGKQLAGAGIDALLVVFYALLMLSYDWTLTLVGVASVAIIAFATTRVNRYRTDGNRKLLQEEGKATGTIMGGLATIETLKASGSESDLFTRWAGYHSKAINAKQQLGIATQVFMVLPPFLTSLTNAVVLGLGAYRIIQGELTIGMLVAFQGLMSSFLAPVNNLVGLAGVVQQMQGNMSRIDDVLRYAPDPQAEQDGAAPLATASGEAGIVDEPSAKLTGHVELRDVTFGYSRLDPPLLTELNVSLAPGARVALVGPSGCGKSTVAKVVTGLYSAWSGEILLDGVQRGRIPRRALVNSVAIVDQDISLFEGTVRENLTLWDPTVPDAVMVRACKDASIHEEIVARRGGYDGFVAEGGANWSGGQRQRLEIARALMTNPRVLMLDEATSALDTVTEQRIDQNLRRRGCTCIIIAHRLSTIRDADEILVLSRGQVVQRGTHDELMKRADGTYARLAREA